LNTHLRDNLDWLKTPPVGTAELTSNITTTSASFVDATGLSITFTTTGGRVLLGCSGILTHSTPGTGVQVTFQVDSTDYGDGTQGMFNVAVPSGAAGMCLSFLTPILSAGNHTFKVRWKTGAATATMVDGTQFFAREV
jgi:hypothetical protein